MIFNPWLNSFSTIIELLLSFDLHDVSFSVVLLSIYFKSISYRQYVVGFYFSIHFYNLCLFIGVFRVFIFSVIIAMIGLRFILSLFVFNLSHLFGFFFPLFLFLSCLLLDYFFKIPHMFSVGFLSVYIRVLTYIFSFLLLFFLHMIYTFKQYYAILYNVRTLLYSFISFLCAIVIRFTYVYVVNDTTHHYYFCFKYEFFKLIGFKDSSKASLG